LKEKCDEWEEYERKKTGSFEHSDNHGKLSEVKVDKNKLEHTGPKTKMIKKVKNDGQNDGNLRDYLAHGLTNNFLFY